MDFIKDTVPGTSRFRGKFDENTGSAGKGFVHHEKRTLEINTNERPAVLLREAPIFGPVKVFE